MAPACLQPLETSGMKKNRYSGSSFDDFLKEEGIYEEVKVLAQKELEALRSEEPLELNDTYDLPRNSPGRLTRFFQWLRHAFNL